ncbi:MAG: hypothetical protein QOG01_2427 [Pseudonocardiales bacterium]|jgi:quinol monooxygenase YgiN|nr:hypothetical protein [Pseudonocardiales bacterium]
MTVVQISQASNREQYQQIAKIVDLTDNRPAGLLLHAATELPDGTVQIVDVYDSAEALEAFGQQRIFPAFAEAGILAEMTARPQPIGYEPFEFVH